LSVAQERIGDVLAAQRDFAGALASYRDALSIRQDLARTDPGHSRWLRNLSIIEAKIADVLAAQGDAAGALANYRDSLAIAQVPKRTRATRCGSGT
jgi:predicted negative regulator of RcsB-dependent stress response